MGAVFICYRRDDSDGEARALFNQLSAIVGKDAVFMDVESISLGRDFREAVQDRLSSIEVMLALIGPHWLDVLDTAGNRRLNNADDYVRQEIASALRRNIRVTPVLVGGARIPTAEQLPEDLKDLAHRHGFELRNGISWNSDVAELVKRLGLSKSASVTSAPSPADRKETTSDAWEGVRHWVEANVAPAYQAQNESEELIETLTASLWRGIVLVGGRMFLTNQRVLFEPATKANMGFLVVYAVAGSRARDRAAELVRWTPVSIPLSAIESVAPSRRFGILPDQISIRCHSGEEYRFKVWGRKRIVEKIETCRKQCQMLS